MFQRIRTLQSEGKSNRAIARELGLDKKTVAKYLKCNAPPRYTKRQAPTKEDPFAAFAAAARGHLALALTGPELYLLLLEQGYQGSERTVERQLGAIRASKPKERFFEQVYGPGEQRRKRLARRPRCGRFRQPATARWSAILSQNAVASAL